MATTKEKLEAAERLIDAVIDRKVDLGVKARHFFGEYRHAFPAVQEESGATPKMHWRNINPNVSGGAVCAAGEWNDDWPFAVDPKDVTCRSCQRAMAAHTRMASESPTPCCSRPGNGHSFDCPIADIPQDNLAA